ncbi:2-C-methyl-D-erythritol 4-phosphate cytidylyltransferase [Kingella sp. SNUBH-2017]|uniref:2-C-methyl-D-erythritol 4-phosphate cytidylyltransferase n=1 Tax=Kingella sp. SNUBH-2017 TaxID=2994077 RepID=UPI002364361D|nr:2-C-methyl-D-erythritol 4-phosphate cytidylyltransferase [Kingella sp. SNUBH-2017]MDD2182726.1 2-C-methyl-D-erythritol 4-phosphate cytidylyltransferase [Kingella sp. SNUBH-2017]
MKYTVLIPAAGSGSRFGGERPKQYALLAGKPVLQHTLDALAANARIGRIAVVLSPQDRDFDGLIRPGAQTVAYRVGGASRAETVANGLNALLADGLDENEVLLVHDAARCCLPQSALNRLLDAAGHPDGAILAVPVADTLKRADNGGAVAATVCRDGLWQAQTPQLFQAALLRRALAAADLSQVTDEASAVEMLGRRPLLVEGDSRNLKLTRPADAALAAWLLAQNG